MTLHGDTPTPTNQLEKAISPQPQPIAQILDRTTALENDFHRERQNYFDKYKNMYARHVADLEPLQKMKNDFEDNLAQSTATIRIDIDQLQKKAAEVVEDCTALEVRAGSLKVKAEAFCTPGSLAQGPPDGSSKSRMDSILIKAVEDMTVELAKWRTKCLRMSEGDISTGVAQDLNARAEAQVLREENSKLCEQQRELETRLLTLQARPEESNVAGSQLQERLQTQQDQFDHDLDTMDKRVKTLEERMQTLEAHAHQQSDPDQTTSDTVDQGAWPDAEKTISMTEKVANLSGQFQAEEQTSMTVGKTSSPPRSDIPTSQCGPILDNKASNNSAEIARLHTPRWSKRTLSEFLSDEIDPSYSEPPRKRTSSQSNTNLPWDSKRGAHSTRDGETMTQRDLFGDWHPQPRSGQAVRQDNSRGSFSGNVEVKRPKSLRQTSSDSGVSHTDGHNKKRSIQAQLNRLPPSDPGPHANKPQGKGSGLTTHDEEHCEDSQGDPDPVACIPFQAPTPRPKRWQNSVLRKKH